MFDQRVLVALIACLHFCRGWLPDTTTKLINNFHKIPAISFLGNTTFPDHFTVLGQDDSSILLGGRNRVYNLSIFDFSERKNSGILWHSSEAHGQLCILKGKNEDDCQNYIRIMFSTQPGKHLICGTNSFKPLCRIYDQKEGKFVMEKEYEGKGLCPYDPEHNSTAIYSNGHLFSGTVADFSGGDPLIYREPLRTEPSDLKQLNAPNFVSSLTFANYIYFFYRETAVEFMNCGKIIYSRVARVCKHDKGGPHLSRNLWTTFLKARLNCSVPGEYPFYFDEIQSTSEIVEGKYGSEEKFNIVYGTLTTPSNAIGGSAICMYNMADIVRVFEGSFKHQESINSNWLPLQKNKVPEPRPGECVQDSRILPDKNVNFIKQHSLMEDAVPAMFGQPILIRISLHYRFTAITVDAQVPTVNNMNFDVIYIGTDDGKVLKVVNIPTATSSKAVVISENEVFPYGAPIKQLKLGQGYGSVVVVGKGDVRLVTLNHCSNMLLCSDCIEIRDPHCGWDTLKEACVSIDEVTSHRYIIQDILYANTSKCLGQNSDQTVQKSVTKDRPVNLDEIILSSSAPSVSTDSNELPLDCNEVDSDKPSGCAVQNRLVLYTSEHLHIIVAVSSLVALFFGFICGYFVSQRFHATPQYPNSPFIEQHNHLDRLNANQNTFLTPRANKAVNLVNVSVESLPPKKDNLGSEKNLNITNDGTLQKIKKTYI